MAVADMSESEDMVDSEFNDFTISDEDLFFFEDEDEDGNVLDLTTWLKQLLKISNPSRCATYPYNNLDYFLNAQNFIDSSDDEQGAITMKHHQNQTMKWK